jgi:hypothetical protein
LISERQLAKSFDSFWQHHFPLLNPTCVRRFNAEIREPVVGANGVARTPIPMGPEMERFDLVAELAFEMARARYETPFTEGDFASAVTRALVRIAELEGRAEISEPFPHELSEAKALLTVYDDFFVRIASEGVIHFQPPIKGAGILDAMEGDFCTTATLYEVKCVNRNLQGSDLRQLLCYLITGLASHKYAWKRYCIFNPRRAVYYSGRIDEFLAYLSGRTPHECINDVLDALMEREQPLESKF